MEGARGVVASDRDVAGLDRLRDELGDLGLPCAVVSGNIVDPAVPGAMVAAAVETFGGFDAAVNNAGIRGTISPLAEMDDATFDEVIDVNLRSVYRCMRAQLPHLYQRGKGSIVNVSSATIMGSMEGIAPYIASKMGVVGLSKVASKEAGRHGVRVNVVAPGRTDTPLMRDHGMTDPDFDISSMAEPIPLGRFGDPQELAQVIVFLASDRSSFVNGATVVADGGRVG